MSNIFLIAEVAQAHDGSLGILHSYIDAIAQTGVDAIKFQTHIAEAESSIHEPFRINFSYEDKIRYDYWNRMGFSLEQWYEIKNHCDTIGIEFMSSPFSLMAVDWLEKIGVQKYKIGSGEVTNFLMLEHIMKTHKEIILSSGMSSFIELDKTLDFMRSYPQDKLSILQCTTMYPTPAEHLGLNIIPELKQKYGLKVGYSDHSGSIFPSIAAASLGAQILEFHAVFDKRMFGPDSSSSLTIDEIKSLVKGVRIVEKSLNNPVDKNNIEQYKSVKSIFEKTLCVNKSLEPGHIITHNDLDTKKPSNMGIAASSYQSVLGKSISKNMNKWDFLTEEDINE